ncbi:MAG: hypothetical protein II037_09570 [Bacteroidales bacterium]|nr:hypothetical protein [Bacteroidales bacterium]
MRKLYKRELGKYISHKLFSRVAFSAILLFFNVFVSFGQNVIYSCNFEDADENASWTLANGNQTNKWYIGTAASNGGENGLYISNDGGTSNSYDTGLTSYVYCFREINLDDNGLFLIEFDWRANG